MLILESVIQLITDIGRRATFVWNHQDQELTELLISLGQDLADVAQSLKASTDTKSLGQFLMSFERATESVDTKRRASLVMVSQVFESVARLDEAKGNLRSSLEYKNLASKAALVRSRLYGTRDDGPEVQGLLREWASQDTVERMSGASLIATRYIYEYLGSLGPHSSAALAEPAVDSHEAALRNCRDIVVQSSQGVLELVNHGARTFNFTFDQVTSPFETFSLQLFFLSKCSVFVRNNADHILRLLAVDAASLGKVKARFTEYLRDDFRLFQTLDRSGREETFFAQSIEGPIVKYLDVIGVKNSFLSRPRDKMVSVLSAASSDLIRNMSGVFVEMGL